MESIPTQSSEDYQKSHAEDSLISFETTEAPAHVEIIRQPSPPPVLAEVQDLIPVVSPQVSEVECGLNTLVTDELVRGETPLQLHIVRFLSTLLISALVFFMSVFGFLQGTHWCGYYSIIIGKLLELKVCV